MKRTPIFIIICIMTILMLTSCQDINIEDSTQEVNASQEGNALLQKEVIFANEVLYGISFVPEDASKTRFRLDEYVSDEGAMYACYIRCVSSPDTIEGVQKASGESDADYAVRKRTYELEQIVDCMLNKGLMVLEEYPYCFYNNEELYGKLTAGHNGSDSLVMGECVVVGSYDQLCEVFNGDEVMEGYVIEILAAPRPDYVDYVYECGYNGEESAYGMAIWCDYYRQDVLDLLGAEYCVMTVSLLEAK